MSWRAPSSDAAPVFLGLLAFALMIFCDFSWYRGSPWQHATVLVEITRGRVAPRFHRRLGGIPNSGLYVGGDATFADDVAGRRQRHGRRRGLHVEHSCWTRCFGGVLRSARRRRVRGQPLL